MIKITRLRFLVLWHTRVAIYHRGLGDYWPAVQHRMKAWSYSTRIMERTTDRASRALAAMNVLLAQATTHAAIDEGYFGRRAGAA